MIQSCRPLLIIKYLPIGLIKWSAGQNYPILATGMGVRHPIYTLANVTKLKGEGSFCQTETAWDWIVAWVLREANTMTTSTPGYKSIIKAILKQTFKKLIFFKPPRVNPVNDCLVRSVIFAFGLKVPYKSL